MRRAKRILLALVGGFLVFAPPGTLLFGVPFVIATAGALLQKQCGTKRDNNNSQSVEKTAIAPHASPTPTEKR